MLIVTGETGVGKTRLVRELVALERVTLLAGSCVPMAGDPLPFAPLTQALRRLDRTGTLNLQLPNLAGIVWYDVKEPTGDFRVGQSAATRTAFKNLATKLSKGCR